MNGLCSKRRKSNILRAFAVTALLTQFHQVIVYKRDSLYTRILKHTKQCTNDVANDTDDKFTKLDVSFFRERSV